MQDADRPKWNKSNSRAMLHITIVSYWIRLHELQDAIGFTSLLDSHQFEQPHHF
jgi:hypothetical protein